ncbi:glycosyltransferase family 2 protein [Halomonas sp. ISL-56]|uniref:glycosyltransferase family 2 protein n=1 Tax=Halomonas sp. ISL-56 TaxID=2819149 RepID=UPI001BE763D6|nr:glycosyltransferase family 2 protein [Halomonas sp. ISL-56]MBT2801002.1 glycosyltransferase family 2 protein [Halomonas sp. ISL-56]
MIRKSMDDETSTSAIIEKKISLVVPAFNEEASIPLFIEAFMLARKEWAFDSHVIIVDDGSSDGSLTLLRQYANELECVHYIAFSRNFGKEAALSAGIDHASGHGVVLMDVDLQHPLSTIPKFVEVWHDQGIDIVYGVRDESNQETPLKRWTSRQFYRFFNKMAHTRLPEGGGDFRLLDKRVVEVLKRLPERNRFMKGLYAWVGFRTQALTYEQPLRVAGDTRFNYWKLWNFALDGIVSFSTWPLRVWSYIGVGVALISFLYGGYIVLRTLMFGADVPGYASLAAGVMFLGGMQLMSIGIIGEYLGRLFIETKDRPLYIVAESEVPDNEN